MGLANRVVPKGQARTAAEELAREVAAFPQGCMRADRMSAYLGMDEPLEDALAAEFSRGLHVLQTESLAGAQRFAGGAGRHGSFKS